MCTVHGSIGIDLEVKSVHIYIGLISRAPHPAVEICESICILYLQGLLELSLVLGIAAGPAVEGGLQEVCMSVDSMCSQATTVL